MPGLSPADRIFRRPDNSFAGAKCPHRSAPIPEPDRLAAQSSQNNGSSSRSTTYAAYNRSSLTEDIVFPDCHNWHTVPLPACGWLPALSVLIHEPEARSFPAAFLLWKFQLEIHILASGIIQHHNGIISPAGFFTVKPGHRNTALFQKGRSNGFRDTFLFRAEKRLSFQRAKAQSLFSQKKPFCPSYTEAPQRGQVPTASRSFLPAANSLVNCSSGAVWAFTSSRFISAIPSIKTSADTSPCSTCFSLDSHSAVSSGDLILSGSTVIRLTPFSVGRSCFFSAPQILPPPAFLMWPHGWQACLSLFVLHPPACSRRLRSP